MLGVDLVEIQRVQKILEQKKEAFLHKILSKEDYAQLKNMSPAHIAGIFAAKEAMGKALGLGIFTPGLEHLSVKKDVKGRPYGVYRGLEFHLSISHEKDYAVAVAQLKDANKDPSFLLMPSKEMAALLPDIRDVDHKGTRGKVAVVGASVGMFGSIDLATKAALRTGAGYAYAVVEENLVRDFSLRVKEVIVRSRGDLSFLEAMDAVAVGPGLGRSKEAAAVVKQLLGQIHMPMVVDADGLYHLKSIGPVLFSDKKIYTPHVGEMARLIDKSIPWVEENRAKAVKIFLSRYGGTVVLKGHESIVANKDQMIYNTTGNAGMATAGSGDVLTGMIASLLAQGLSCFNAAMLGVYIHGFSGDIAAVHKSRYGLIASDLITYLPEVLRRMEQINR